MSEFAIDLTDVSVRLDGRTVLDAINLRVRPGEFLALIGPNGAGKTVLLKTILGLIRPATGTVRVCGRPPDRARGLMGYVPQHAGFDRDFPIRVLDVVLMGRLGHSKLGRPFASADRDAAYDALGRVEAQHVAHRPIGALSGGELQRVLIARALVMKPSVLLLDEPASNLDLRVGSGLYTMLDALKADMTIVIVSHDVSVIARHVESVACLNRTLHYHGPGEITREQIEAVYGCPVDFIVHRHTHRVLEPHEGGAP